MVFLPIHPGGRNRNARGRHCVPRSRFTLKPGTPQQVSFTAAASAPLTTATVTITGTAGTLVHSTSLSLAVTTAVPTATNVDIVTYHDDVARTGLNPNETALTPSDVTSSSSDSCAHLPSTRLVDGQPLYLANLSVAGQAQNVVFAVTEHDSVYAFNADTGSQLWKRSVLGTNETTSGDHDCSQITPEIGITSTPVIDRSAGPLGTIFVVGMSQDQSGAYHQRLHALDVTTGAELTGSPTEITAAYTGAGANSSGGKVVFDPGQYAERAALLLLNGTIYLGWTSHCDAEPYTGWLMGYSESSLAQTTVLNLTPNGSDGAIWMSGAGMAADSSGNIYFLDANGTFDTTLTTSGFPSSGDFGNSFLKVSTAERNSRCCRLLRAIQYCYRIQTTILILAPAKHSIARPYGLTGTVHHLAVGAGKDQNIYVVNRDSMGKFSPQNDAPIYQQIAGAIGRVYSMPAYFNNTVYYGAVSDTLKAFSHHQLDVGNYSQRSKHNQFRLSGNDTIGERERNYERNCVGRGENIARGASCLRSGDAAGALQQQPGRE